MLYNYRCVIRNIVDGDTVDVDIDLGFDVWLHNERIRISGIDCPEVRTRDPIEKIFGQLATARVKELLPLGSNHILNSTEFRKGGFGRILGDIILPDFSTLSKTLLNERHAVVWTPNDRESMKQSEIHNRQWLMEHGTIPTEIRKSLVQLMETFGEP